VQAAVCTVACIFFVSRSRSATLSPQGSQIFQIPPQSVTRFRVQRIVVYNILQAADRIIDLAFVEMISGQLAIEVRQIPLGVFIPRDFLSVVPLEILRPPQIVLYPVNHFARVLMISAIDLRRRCYRKTGKNRGRRYKCTH
jgi:hypothetical protein